MTRNDFKLAAVGLFGPHNKITAFLQGGLAVTGTWDWLNPPRNMVPNYPTSIVVTDGTNTRHVVPIDAITSLREVAVGPVHYRAPDGEIAELLRRVTTKPT